jgi:hypothetical protein
VFLWEVENWGAKILHRKNYLFGVNGQGGIYQRVQDALQKLDQAQTKIDEFLNDPRVAALRDLDESDVSPESNGQVIYAWRDDPKPGQAQGLWHAVFAEAKIPTLCGGNCKRTTCVRNDATFGPRDDGDCPSEPNLPKIHAFNSSKRQWYSIIDYLGKGDCYNTKKDGKNYVYPSYCFKGGLTKVRVIRYDQEDDSLILKFVTSNFWKMRSDNPNANSPASPNEIQNACATIMGGGVVNGAWGREGAVLLNEPTNENLACWNLMTGLLKRGIESRSCAEYFYRQQPWNYSPAFGVKFVECPSGPLNPW